MPEIERLLNHGPPKSSYIKYNKNALFSYSSENADTFQHGYLGIGPSSVSGSLHLRYSDKSPLIANSIELVFIGDEFITYQLESDNRWLSTTRSQKFAEYTYCLWESKESQSITNLDLRFNIQLEDDLPGSFICILPESGKIEYIIQARVKMNNNHPEIITSARCHLTRWSLPFTKMLNEPIKMKRPDYNKSNNKSYIDDILFEGLLDKFWYEMGSEISVQLNLKLPRKDIAIKNIKMRIHEFQSFVNPTNGLNEILAMNKLRALSCKINGVNISTFYRPEEDIYALMIGTNVPPLANNQMTPELIGTKIMQFIQIWHRLRIKVNFRDNKQLILQTEIGIRNCLSSKEIQNGRHNGTIYPES
ncbi:3007_t:CDS:1 [Acaulospora morrowiae]|uniref:3007_t:CDS:1 n=1 Tax=Acaulospora morrowiae TaxID=94023 RepID=A0A9N9CCN1_9GLOM|nr:3007_t:CDS:1 [Acaulospora morrowiae]